MYQFLTPFHVPCVHLISRNIIFFSSTMNFFSGAKISSKDLWQSMLPKSTSANSTIRAMLTLLKVCFVYIIVCLSCLFTILYLFLVDGIKLKGPRCQSCRYQACLDAGMYHSGIQVFVYIFQLFVYNLKNLFLYREHEEAGMVILQSSKEVIVLKNIQQFSYPTFQQL